MNDYNVLIKPELEMDSLYIGKQLDPVFICQQVRRWTFIRLQRSPKHRWPKENSKLEGYNICGMTRMNTGDAVSLST